MAALPLIIGLASTFLPPLIKGAEVLIQGPQKGETKRSVVMAAFRAACEALGTSGAVPAAAPSDEVLAALVEKTFQELSARGEVNATVAKSATVDDLPQVLIRAALKLMEAK